MKMNIFYSLLCFLLAQQAAAQCTYTLNMVDSYGDGWDGGYVTVLVNGVAIGTYSASGSGTTSSFTAANGATVAIRYTAGSWESENSYTLSSSGTTVYTSSTPPATGSVYTTTCSTGGSTSSNTSNITCGQMAPICTGTAVSYQAQATGTIEPGFASGCSQSGAGNDYGCLCSQPDPTWYYFQIANPGNIDFNITASSDVDFALWGPYASLAAAQNACGNLPTPIDCSYSTAAVENVSVPVSTTGQVYVLLITNYANIVQLITAQQTGGTGSTNCSIVTNPCAANAGGW